jgi:hypothetical protein
MKQRARIGLLFTVVLTSAAARAVAACGSDENASRTPLTVDGGTDASASRAEPGSDARAPQPQLTCAFYCDQITANCTGDNAQYVTRDECMRACDAFPKGSLSDTQGNTLGCRIYHSGAPSVSAPATHCPHGGPFGFGGCGSQCEGFCEVVDVACGADAGLFTNGGCLTECPRWTSNGAPSPKGPALQCREYHLGVALFAPAAHCPHLGTSPDHARCPTQ